MTGATTKFKMHRLLFEQSHLTFHVKKPRKTKRAKLHRNRELSYFF